MVWYNLDVVAVQEVRCVEGDNRQVDNYTLSAHLLSQFYWEVLVTAVAPNTGHLMHPTRGIELRTVTEGL
jgi:hypothetical protein